MNYRHVYMLIVEHARKEALEGKRPLLKKERKNFNQPFEFHHILPKSLFPLWETKESNLIPLTPREHFFCHQLLTKIWPTVEMFRALSMFCVFNQKARKLTSKQYEVIRKAAIEANKLYFKEEHPERSKKLREAAKRKTVFNNKKFINLNIERFHNSRWYNDGINEYFVISPMPNWKQGRLKLSDEKLEKKRQKIKERRANMTPEEKAVDFKRRSEANKKFVHKKRGPTGKHWYNNGIENKQFLSCPQGWQEGKLTHREGKKVVCIETGEIFYAKDLPGVHKNCNGYRNAYKGLHYQWYSGNLEGGVSENLSNT